MHLGAREEWRKYWTVVLAAALGHGTTTLPVYSLGPFMSPLQEEFGWSRAAISLGASVSAIVSSAVGIGVGILMDRWGPRQVGLIGMALFCSAFAALSTTTNSIGNWLFHWALLGCAAAWIKPTIWSSAVASRFDVSRGLAISVTVSGAGVGMAVLPPLTTFLIAGYGWRLGFAGIGILWGLIVLPTLYLFFFGAQDARRGSPRPRAIAGDLWPGLSTAQGLKSPTFYKLGFAGLLFGFAAIGLIMHFVPVLESLGISRISAASIAGLIGLSSIAGRLGSGFLIDRLRADRVAMGAFLLPVISAILLLNSNDIVVLSIAALLLGLAAGSEFDVIMYLATRHFGLRRLGSLFAVMLIFLAAGTSIGPVVAGAIFDRFGDYTFYIWLLFPLVTLGSLLIGTLGPYPVLHSEPEGETTPLV